MQSGIEPPDSDIRWRNLTNLPEPDAISRELAGHVGDRPRRDWRRRSPPLPARWWLESATPSDDFAPVPRKSPRPRNQRRLGQEQPYLLSASFNFVPNRISATVVFSFAESRTAMSGEIGSCPSIQASSRSTSTPILRASQLGSMRARFIAPARPLDRSPLIPPHSLPPVWQPTAILGMANRTFASSRLPG